MTFNLITDGDPILAAPAMQNWRHVNYGSDLIPVNASGVGVNGSLNSGSSSYRWAGVYAVAGNFTGTVNTGILLSIGGASGYTAIFGRYPGAGNTSGLFLHSEATESHYNFKISTQDTIGSALTIQASTVIGGTTWGASLFTVYQTGTIDINGALNISPTSTSGSQKGIRLYDSGTGSGEGLYIQWESASRADMAKILGLGEATGSSLNFYTNSANSGSATNRMVLDASGNLGIGNLVPTYRLDVAITSGPYSGRFQNTSTSTSQYNLVRFAQGAGSGAASGYLGTGGSAVGNTAFAGNMVIGTDNSSGFVIATNDTARAWMTATGNFGIGINPSIKFEVVNSGTPSGYLSSTIGSFINSSSAGTNCYISIQSGTTGVAGFSLGDSGASDIVKLYLDNNTNILNFNNLGNIFSWSSAGVFAITGTMTLSGKATFSDTVTIAQHKASITLGSDKSINDNTSTVVPFTSNETYDTGGLHSTSVNTTRITVLEAGNYLVIGSITYAPAANGRRSALIYINGSPRNEVTIAPVNGNITTVTNSQVIPLSANDYIELYGYQSSGGAINMKALESTSLTAIKLS